MSDDEKKKDRSWMRGWLIGLAVPGCLVSLFLINQVTSNFGPAQLPIQAEAAQAQATRRPTRTPAPTYAAPTVDLVATNVILGSIAQAAQADAADAQQRAIFAQQTAVEADVQAAQIQRDREQIALDAERLRVGSTQAAAVITQTAYPLIATADALRIADLQQQRAYTAAEPLRVQAMAEAQYQAQYGWLDAWVKIAIVVVLFALAALSVTHIVLWIWKAAMPVPVPVEAHFIEPEPAEVTPVAVLTGSPSYAASDYHDIPCSGEQLTELAEGLLHEHKTLAINVWEGAGTLFNRRVFTNVLGWMLRVGYATRDASQTAALTAEGEGFLRGWEESQQLPHPYRFNPDHAHNTASPSHNHGESWPNGGGGVGRTDAEAA